MEELLKHYQLNVAEIKKLEGYGSLNYHIKDKYVWIVALSSVILIMLISNIPPDNLGGYVLGYELLPINGLLTFIGLILIRRK